MKGEVNLSDNYRKDLIELLCKFSRYCDNKTFKAVDKKRAWQAPEGSGVPVGTKYHWYILAHQKNVRKLDANSYSISMAGLKYKLAHKRVGTKRWSATENAQRERLIKILEEYIVQLKREMVEEAAKGPTPTIYYRT